MIRASVLSLFTISFLAVGAISSCSMLYAKENAIQHLPPIRYLFSSEYYYDQSAFYSRDWNKPYYLYLRNKQNKNSLPFTIDIGSDVSIALTDRSPNASTFIDVNTLKVSIASQKNENAKDKILANIVPHWDKRFNILKGGSVGFLAFDFMLDKKYPVSKYWTIHLQVIQCCAGHPPFTMHVRPSNLPTDSVNMQFSYRNDRLESNLMESTFFETPMERGRWYHLVFRFAPSPDDAGKAGGIALWLDGKRASCLRDTWGFNYSLNTRMSSMVTNNLGIDVGIYRRGTKLEQSVYFGNIIYSESAKEVGLELESFECK